VLTDSDFIESSTVTICAWVKPRSTGQNQAGQVFNNSPLFFGAYGYGSNCWFISNDNGSHSAFSANESISLNTWQYVCGIRAGNQGTIYVNGVLSGSTNQNIGTPGVGWYAPAIGNRSEGDSYTFDGSIDEVRAYSRALTASEIGDLYRLGQVEISR
jgi:hypothetical protein